MLVAKVNIFNSGYFWILILTILIFFEVMTLAMKNWNKLTSSFKKDEIGGERGIFGEIDYYSKSALTLASLTFVGITFLVSTFPNSLSSIRTELILFLGGFFLFIISYRLDVVAGVKRFYWEIKQRTLIYGLYALILGSSLILKTRIENLLPMIVVAWTVIIFIHIKEHYDTLRDYDANSHDAKLLRFFKSNRIDVNAELKEKLKREALDEGLKLEVEFLDKNFDPRPSLKNYFSRFIGSIFYLPSRLSKKLEDEEMESLWYHELAHIKFIHPLISGGVLITLTLLIWLKLPHFLIPIFQFLPSLEIFVYIIIFIVEPVVILALLFIPHLYLVHRRLEFWADDYAKEETSGESLANGLEKGDRWMKQEEMDMNSVKMWLSNLAHPDIDERIKRLKED